MRYYAVTYPRQSATVSYMAVPQQTEQSLDDRVRENIRILKGMLKVTDAVIAERAGFSSRQMIADRLGGRVGLSLRDIDVISQALRVDRDALLSPASDMIQWVTSNRAEVEAPAVVLKRRPRKQVS